MRMTPSCTSPLELTQPPSHLHHLCADRKSTPPQQTSEMLSSFFVFRGQWLAPTCRLSSGTLPQLWLPPAGPRWCRSPPPPGSAVPAGGWSDPSHNPNPQPEHVAVPSADIHSTTIDSSSSLYYYVVACRFELFLFVKRTFRIYCASTMFDYDILYLLVQVLNDDVLHLAWRWVAVLLVESSMVPSLKQLVRHGRLCFNRNFSFKTNLDFNTPAWLSQTGQIKYFYLLLWLTGPYFLLSFVLVKNRCAEKCSSINGVNHISIINKWL